MKGEEAQNSIIFIMEDRPSQTDYESLLLLSFLRNVEGLNFDAPRTVFVPLDRSKVLMRYTETSGKRRMEDKVQKKNESSSHSVLSRSKIQKHSNYD